MSQSLAMPLPETTFPAAWGRAQVIALVVDAALSIAIVAVAILMRWPWMLLATVPLPFNAVESMSRRNTRYEVGRRFVRIRTPFRTRTIAGANIGSVTPTALGPSRRALAIRDRAGKRLAIVTPADPDAFIDAVQSLAMM